MKIKLFANCEIRYFELGIFSFNSSCGNIAHFYTSNNFSNKINEVHVSTKNYLSRGFIASTRTFNLLTRAFNHATHTYRLPTRGSELVTRGFELVTCNS